MRPGFDAWVGKIPWKRQWLPTLVFLLGEFHELRNLAGYNPWGCKESDTTEQLTLSFSYSLPGLQLMFKEHLLNNERARIWESGFGEFRKLLNLAYYISVSSVQLKNYTFSTLLSPPHTQSPNVWELLLYKPQCTYETPAFQKTLVRACVGKIPWRSEGRPTPVFLPRKSHGQRSLAGYTVHKSKLS